MAQKTTFYLNERAAEIIAARKKKFGNVQAWLNSAIVLAHRYGERMERFVSQEPKGLSSQDIDRFYAAVERLESLRISNVHVPDEVNRDVEELLNMFDM